jgi:hypothetical protein
MSGRRRDEMNARTSKGGKLGPRSYPNQFRYSKLGKFARKYGDFG